MQRLIGVVVLGGALGLAACASNSYCLGEQDYQKAESVPTVQPVEGLKIPQSQSALVIPPPPEKTEPYGKVVKDAAGDDQTVCLDQPPKMAEPVDKPVETTTDKPTPAVPVPTKPGEPVGPPSGPKPASPPSSEATPPPADKKS